MGGFVKLVLLVAEVPFWFFATALGLIRAGIGLVLLVGLGSCVSDAYVAERLAGVRSHEENSEGGGEGWRVRARAAAVQTAEDRRREAAAVAHAQARYQAEERRPVERSRTETR